MEDVKKAIFDELKAIIQNKHISAPGKISFFAEGTELHMELTVPGCGIKKGRLDALNMQNDDAAFEGWAAILHTYYMPGRYEKLILDVLDAGQLPGSEKDTAFEDNAFNAVPHYGRFLYRVWKFSEQYGSWFELCEELKNAVDSFKNYIGERQFTNNYSVETAQDKGNLESVVEGCFTGDGYHGVLHTLLNNAGLAVSENCEIYRQLHVGLFEGNEDNEKKKVFVGKQAAIDLWAIYEDELLLFELKTRNKMVGSVTELFFYANYIWDMYIDKTPFSPQEPKKNLNGKSENGYEALYRAHSERRLKRIRAFWLVDEKSKHPLLADGKALAALNIANDIIFDVLQYNLSIEVSADAKKQLYFAVM